MAIGVPAAIGIGAGAGLASSYMGGNAIKDASSDATKQINYQNNQTRNDFRPYREGGLNAFNSYQDALGLGGSWQNTADPYDTWKAANPGKNRRESYQNYLNQFNKGDWTPSEAGGQRTDMYGEFNAPEGSGLPQYSPGQDLAQYSAQGYNPEYNSTGQFGFNLENDSIYNFAQDEGIRAATRHSNAVGGSNSGNALEEIRKRASLDSLGYQDRAFGRQLAESQENYGRGVQDYNIEAARGRDIYNRGTQDYGINADRNNTMYNRGISTHGIDTDLANSVYGRGQNEWNLNEYGMNNDIYGRDQNYLNRLSQQASGGQNAVAQLGGFGATAANQIGNLGMAGGAAQAGQWQGANNAVQGTIGNYLTHDLYSKNPWAMEQANPFGGDIGGPQFNGGRGQSNWASP